MHSTHIHCLLFLTTCLCTGVRAQCPAGNVVLETNAEVADFLALFPDCSDFRGDLNIQGNVSNIDGLKQLTSEARDLTIRNTLLTDLAPLDNILTIGRALSMSTPNLIDDISTAYGRRRAGAKQVVATRNL